MRKKDAVRAKYLNSKPKKGKTKREILNAMRKKEKGKC